MVLLSVVVLAGACGNLVLAAEEAPGSVPPVAPGSAAQEAPAPQPAPATAPVPAPAPAPASGPEVPPPAGFPINGSSWTPIEREHRRENQPSPIQFQAPSPINELEKKLNYPIDGSLSVRYRLRLTSDQSDQDLTELLSMRFGDPERNKVSGEFLGRLNEDLDGQGPRGEHRTFRDITDAHDQTADGRFYLGYVNLRRFAILDRLGLDTVRLGRQTYDESAETFTFDGGRIDTVAFEDLKWLRLSAYGGHPAHYFESSGEGDAVAGVGSEIRPIHRGRARVDWTWVQDRFFGGETFKNDLLSLAYWQGIGDHVTLHGRYNFADWESRDYLVRGTFQQPEWGFLFQAGFHQVIKTLFQYSTELDYYFPLLREYRPYWEVDLHASKGLGDHFVVDGGVLLRQLSSEDSEGIFNHEFVRYYLTPGTRNWPVEGMSLSLTGEVWDQPGEDEVYTLGGEISQRILKVLNASFGSTYSLYQYDFLSGQERIHDRTFYWKLEYQVLKDLKLAGLYRLERDDLSTYHTVEVGLRYSF